ncbi:tRNA lysidine(34) synthetase TilS [Bacillus alkalicellulosilyticus]|uniref:tRNA lysidine(34) synthetase TilS n=1 Tax=Alkalihalobacterium alkalicellulosilyticum TaxID=1912214 RepID=UPI0009969958|nr:tRNA lysidine(34) synthetase TilS [Bacillus alkalicellulosilyticus]
MNRIVKEFIETHQLLQPGIVVVGVSGGPDSLALLHFLWTHQDDYSVELVAAHVDHQFRGEESYEDFLFVENFCHSRNIPFEGKRIDVKAYQKKHHLSAQVAARECRYQFFSETMVKYGANMLALGHHGDDQVETMLMKQVRGAYGFGLAGIPFRRDFSTGYIIRPFLGITKGDIEQYCIEEKLSPRLDKSNQSQDYTRNRFRQNILPFLKEENKNVHVQFQKQSEWVIEDQSFLENLTQQALEKVIIDKKVGSVVIDVLTARQMPKALQRRGIHLILKYLYGKNHPIISMIHIEHIANILHSSHPSGQINLPKGVEVVRSYDICSFIRQGRTEKVTTYEHQLSISGEVDVGIGKITAGITTSYKKSNLQSSIYIGDSEHIAFPLTIRSWKEGDRISPMGLSGSKKVSRVFIDNKVDMSKRKIWPVIVDGEGEILWVPGLIRSKKAKVSEQTASFLLLSFEAYQ